jgi:hypothetical protein
MLYPQRFFEINLRFAQKVAGLAGQPLDSALLHYTNLYVRFGVGWDLSAANPIWQEYTDYIDWETAEAITLPKLKPSTRTISLRRPEFMLSELRVIANKRDVPYQSLIKIFLKEQIDQELKRDAGVTASAE